MSNVIIPGENVKTKKDAEKFLKDTGTDVSFLKPGWKEHKQKLKAEDRKYKKEMHRILKDRVKDRRFSMPYREGQWEKIFGKKDKDCG